MGNPMDGTAQALAAHVGDESARSAIAAAWEALKRISAQRPDLVHPGIGDYVAAAAVLGAVVPLTDYATNRERERQCAYLYSIIQSAEESEGGGPETDVERAYDAGILYAARMLLFNEAGDTDWRAELYEYADEIRRRTEPGTPLPGRERKVVEAALAWREAFDDPEADMNGPADVLARAVDALDQEGDDTNA